MAKQFFVAIFKKSLNSFRGDGQKWIVYKKKVYHSENFLYMPTPLALASIYLEKLKERTENNIKVGKNFFNVVLDCKIFTYLKNK